MRPPARATAELFQREVADLLELPPGSDDAEVRKALLAKGEDFLAWYKTRLQAISESVQQAARPPARAAPRTRRRVHRHY